MQGIYLIENIETNEIYVGQSTDIIDRWRRHTYNIGHKRYLERALYKAFNKYGIESFRFSILEIVEDEELLTEREIYWYNELNPEYNKNLPSKSDTRKVALTNLTTGEILEEYNSISEASRKTKRSVSNIWQHCNNKISNSYKSKELSFIYIDKEGS